MSKIPIIMIIYIIYKQFHDNNLGCLISNFHTSLILFITIRTTVIVIYFSKNHLIPNII